MSEQNTSDLTVADFLKNQSLSILLSDLSVELRSWINYRAAHYDMTPEEYLKNLIKIIKEIQEIGVDGSKETLKMYPNGDSKYYNMKHPFI
jgi:hypothetical protein